MTSPSEKPFDALDNPPHGAQTESDNAIERHKQDEDAVQSPYAPKLKRRIRTAPRAQDSDGSEPEIPRFLLGGERLGESVDGMKSEDHLLWMGGATELTPAERRDEPEGGQGLPESEEGAHAPPKDTEASAAGTAQEVASPAEPAARSAESSEGNTAADIERLEASLRWLKQQSGELRGSHADAPLQVGRAPELDKIDIGAARSLEPENLLPPALMRAQRGNMESGLASRRVPLLILIAGLVAAPIAYFTAEKSSSAPEYAREARLVAVEPQIVAPLLKAKPESEPQEATVEPRPIAVPAAGSPQGDVNASERGDSKSAPASDSKPDAVSALPAPVSTPPVAVSPPPTAVSPPAAAASGQEAAPAASPPLARSKASDAPAVVPSRALSRADIELLMKQGEQFMAVGDVAAARIVFRRAAEAGDAAAALAMGTTYDPLILKRMGALGVTPDPYQARSWYERAKDFGSSEAPRRIEMLANR